MTIQPLVSVIMTVYNGERFLQEALDGILGQTFADFELIVVDDASTDSTPALLAACTDPRVKIVTNRTNIGPYRAANVGLESAQGELIARHDADDVSLPERLEIQVARMNSQKSLVLLGTSYHVVDDRGRILETSLLPTENSDLQARLEKGNIFLHGTFMMRRDALERVGGYREYFPVSQDYDLSLRLAEQGEIANIPEPLYLFRFHSSSISRNKRELQLACRQLAWSLAVARRQGEPEGQIPENVLEVFPPEADRLLSEALGKTYLYYAADRKELAEMALWQAEEISSEMEDKEIDWSGWVLSRAHHFSAVRDEVSEGATFIDWATGVISHRLSDTANQEILGRFYADQAFLAYEKGCTSSITVSAWRAVRHDKSWLRNRGLWSIALRSLVR